MKWFSTWIIQVINLVKGNKKTKLTSIENSSTLDNSEPEDLINESKAILLSVGAAKLLITALKKRIKYPNRYIVPKNIENELDNIEQIYSKHILDNCSPNNFPPVTLKFSKEFTRDWIEEGFNEAFNSYNRVNRKDASELNSAYRSLKGSDNNTYLKHYKNYYN